MEKWIIEFEIICEIMSKEVEKRKEISGEISRTYEKMWELHEKSRKSLHDDERGRIEEEIERQNERINFLESEYNKVNYAIHILKQARIDVLER